MKTTQILPSSKAETFAYALETAGFEIEVRDDWVDPNVFVSHKELGLGDFLRVRGTTTIEGVEWSVMMEVVQASRRGQWRILTQPRIWNDRDDEMWHADSLTAAVRWLMTGDPIAWMKEQT